MEERVTAASILAALTEAIEFDHAASVYSEKLALFPQEAGTECQFGRTEALDSHSLGMRGSAKAGRYSHFDRYFRPAIAGSSDADRNSAGAGWR